MAKRKDTMIVLTYGVICATYLVLVCAYGVLIWTHLDPSHAAAVAADPILGETREPHLTPHV